MEQRSATSWSATSRAAPFVSSELTSLPSFLRTDCECLRARDSVCVEDVVGYVSGGEDGIGMD